MLILLLALVRLSDGTDYMCDFAFKYSYMKDLWHAESFSEE